MSSSIDQMNEQIVLVTQGQPAPARKVVTYAYVVMVKGEWKSGTFTGNVVDCIDHIEVTLKVDLGDAKVRWARGHVDDDGNFKIHPANDADAIKQLQKLLEPKARRR